MVLFYGAVKTGALKVVLFSGAVKIGILKVAQLSGTVKTGTLKVALLGGAVKSSSGVCRSSFFIEKKVRKIIKSSCEVQGDAF